MNIIDDVKFLGLLRVRFLAITKVNCTVPREIMTWATDGIKYIDAMTEDLWRAISTGGAGTNWKTHIDAIDVIIAQFRWMMAYPEYKQAVREEIAGCAKVRETLVELEEGNK